MRTMNNSIKNQVRTIKGGRFTARFLHDFPSGIKTEVCFINQLRGGDLLIAIVDSHNEVYSPIHPALIADGEQIVKQGIEKAIAEAGNNQSALDIVLQGNRNLRAGLEAINHERKGNKLRQLDLDDAARIPGATAVIAKIEAQTGKMEMFQNCDAGAIYRGNSGSAITDYGWKMTPYRNWETELYHQRTIQELLAKVGGEKAKMWDEFYWLLSASRRRVNNRSSQVVIINGTAAFEDYAASQVLEGEAFPEMMFFTDGALYDPYAFPEQRHLLLEQWLKRPDIGVFPDWNRKMRAKLVNKTHVYGGIPEATLLQLNFNGGAF